MIINLQCKYFGFLDLILNLKVYKPCFENVQSYATAFLFFIETETTVGELTFEILLKAQIDQSWEFLF